MSAAAGRRPRLCEHVQRLGLFEFKQGYVFVDRVSVDTCNLRDLAIRKLEIPKTLNLRIVSHVESVSRHWLCSR